MPALRRGAAARSTVRTLRRLASLLFVAALAVTWAPRTTMAAERGTIRGEIIDGTSGDPVARVDVQLLGGKRDESGDFSEDVRRRAVTDAEGRFTFSGLPTGSRHAYTVDASYLGGLFTGGVITLPSRTSDPPVVDATLKVWDTTTDPQAIVVQRNAVFVVRGEDGEANIVESYRIVNVSEQAYVGRGAEMGAGAARGPIPSMSFPIPPEGIKGGVQIVDSTLNVPRLVQTETGLGVTTAVPPNESSISFLYRLPVSTGQIELSRRVLYPTLNFDVFAEPPYEIESNRLVEGAEASIEGTKYRQYNSDDTIGPGDPVQVVARAEGSGDTALIIGAAAVGIVVLGLVAFALVRWRRSTGDDERITGSSGPRPARREELLTAIAELDLAHQNGEVSDDDHAARRAELKTRLVESSSAEPAS
jgi:hypothetical protein